MLSNCLSMSVALAQLKLSIKPQQQSNDYLVFSFFFKQGLLPHKIIGESCSLIEKGKKKWSSNSRDYMEEYSFSH